ncbi:MAG TPA: hypothetical protein VFT82_03750 [Candidatus Paceibacterota bacterium]|nr:hypothetical protein [Candidatus Paceibacterota bacterium]
MPRKPRAPKRSGEVVRIQFDMPTEMLAQIEEVFAKKGVKGHKQIFRTGAMVFMRLAAEPDYAKVKMLDLGMLEIERTIKPGTPVVPATL